MSGFDLPGLGSLGPQLRALGTGTSGQGPLTRRLFGEEPTGVERPAIDATRIGEKDGVGATGSFGDALAGAIDKVDSLRDDVQDKFESLATGEPVALHDIMLAMGKSEVAFNLMLEVRNKLVDAWEKLSRSVV